jgi:hypothetical protein
MTSTAKTIVYGEGSSPASGPADAGGKDADTNLGVSSGPAPGFVSAPGTLLGYARVSTAGQMTDRPEDALR